MTFCTTVTGRPIAIALNSTVFSQIWCNLYVRFQFRGGKLTFVFLHFFFNMITAITCSVGDLLKPRNGYLSCRGKSNVGVGEICEVKCKNGFIHKNGARFYRCQGNGAWNPSTNSKTTCKGERDYVL